MTDDMTDPKNVAKVDAMQAIFDLSDAISEGSLSILDLQDCIRTAVSEGHGMLAVQMAMVSIAASNVEKEVCSTTAS